VEGAIVKMITAIVRTTALEHIAKSLTISEIKGTGEEVPLFKHYTIHDKIEIIVPDDEADEAARTILEESGTGLAVDGIIAAAPLDYALKIRTRERMT
jgi:nitrogen regulatory protein PII